MGPFAKKPFALTMTGVTNNEQDPSVDVLRTVTLPLVRRFGVDDGLELKVSFLILFSHSLPLHPPPLLMPRSPPLMPCVAMPDPI